MKSSMDSSDVRPIAALNSFILPLVPIVADVVVAEEPEVLHQAHLARQLVVVGDDGAAFEGC